MINTQKVIRLFAIIAIAFTTVLLNGCAYFPILHYAAEGNFGIFDPLVFYFIGGIVIMYYTGVKAKEQNRNVLGWLILSFIFSCIPLGMLIVYCKELPRKHHQTETNDTEKETSLKKSPYAILSEIREILDVEPVAAHLQKLISCPHDISTTLFESLKKGTPMDYFDAETGQELVYNPKEYSESDIKWAQEVLSITHQGEEKGGIGNHKEAIPLLTKALKMAPGNDLILLTLGVSYAEEGNFPVSLEIMKKAINLHPNNQRIRNNYEAIKNAAQ